MRWSQHYYDVGIAVGAQPGVGRARAPRRGSDVVRRNRDHDPRLCKACRGWIAHARRARRAARSRSPTAAYSDRSSDAYPNLPQVGILGSTRSRNDPVAVNGQVVVKPMMYVALSYDHRIVDGLEAVQFLVKVKELIEDPGQMLIEL